MGDRELLELAAKGAGYDVFCESRKVSRGNDCLEHFIRIDGRELIWNPLTNDGDAFRALLAIFAKISHAEWSDIHVQLFRGNPTAARRAIVLAAAELGRTRP